MAQAGLPRRGAVAGRLPGGSETRGGFRSPGLSQTRVPGWWARAESPRAPGPRRFPLCPGRAETCAHGGPAVLGKGRVLGPDSPVSGSLALRFCGSLAHCPSPASRDRQAFENEVS